MIAILSKIFIKEELSDVTVARKAYGSLCSVLGICLNVLLFGFKYFAGIISGSIAITADAFNNLSDAGSSFITLAGFWLAGKKPDLEHPFGHGRFEYVSGFVVSIAILLMGVELARSSIDKILHPKAIDTSLLSVVILVVSIAIKLYMAYYNRKIGRRIHSSAMEAASVDSLSDAAATTMVLVAVLVMRFVGINIDGICGVMVAFFILYAGFQAAKDTIDPLLGKVPDEEFVQQVKDIVMAHEGILGTHDLAVHDYGPGRLMLSIHAEVPGNGNIYEIHEVIDHIERELRERLGCEAVIHMDPIEVDNVLVNQLKEKTALQMKQIHEDVTIHDFRMVTGKQQTNLIFDIVVPYEVPLCDEVIREKVQELVEQMDKSYVAVVDIDKPYVK